MNWLNNNKKWISIIAVVVLLLLILSHIGVRFIEDITNNGGAPYWILALAIVLLYALKGVTMFIPTTLLYIAAGITLPTWLAIPVTYIGLTVALSIGHSMGKKLGEEKVSAIISKHRRIAEFFDGNKENVLSLCFMTHLLPTPLGFVSLFFGTLNMPLVKYIFISLLGISPYMIPVVFAGAAIDNPLSAAFLVPLGISIFITLIIVVIYKTKASARTRAV